MNTNTAIIKDTDACPSSSATGMQKFFHYENALSPKF